MPPLTGDVATWDDTAAGTPSDPKTTWAPPAAPSAHTHDAGDIVSGVLDGDRLPAMSAAKRGGVPATGNPSGKYLKDDGTFDSPAGGSTPTLILTLATNEETDQVAPVVVGGMAINPGTWAGATFTFRAIAGGDIDGRAGKVQLWDLTDGDLKHALSFSTAAPAVAGSAVVLDAAEHLYEVRIYTDAGWIYLTSAWLEVSP